MSPLHEGGAPNADFAGPARAGQPVPGWQVAGQDQFARFAIRRDGQAPVFAAWPEYAGGPSKVRMVSDPFQLPANCRQLTFSGRSAAGGDGLDLQLLGETRQRFLGSYPLTSAWQTVTLPVGNELAGQELHLEVTIFISSEVLIRSLGSLACF